MFVENNLNSEDVTLPASAWNVIQKQAESLSARDKQIEDLIGLLKEQIQESKKTVARQDDNAICADVG